MGSEVFQTNSGPKKSEVLDPEIESLFQEFEAAWSDARVKNTITHSDVEELVRTCVAAHYKVRERMGVHDEEDEERKKEILMDGLQQAFYMYFHVVDSED